MENNNTKPLSKVIRIDESEIRGHLDEMVRGSVEGTINAMLDAEADEMCKAQRYEHSPDRIDTRAGHYTRKLHTKAGEVEVKMPRLRKQTFETAIIERHRRRDISIEEAIVQMYLAGVSVRRVEDITEALWGTRVSSGTVSKLNQKVYKHIETWRNQPIEGRYALSIWMALCSSAAGAVRSRMSRCWRRLVSTRTAFVEDMQCRMDPEQSLQDIPKPQKLAPPRPLEYFASCYPSRNEVMARAYRSGHYTLAEVGAHFGVSYVTVSRAVKAFEGRL